MDEGARREKPPKPIRRLDRMAMTDMADDDEMEDFKIRKLKGVFERSS